MVTGAQAVARLRSIITVLKLKVKKVHAPKLSVEITSKILMKNAMMEILLMEMDAIQLALKNRAGIARISIIVLRNAVMERSTSKIKPTNSI